MCCAFLYRCVFFFQAEDGIRDLVRSRGLGDVYKRQVVEFAHAAKALAGRRIEHIGVVVAAQRLRVLLQDCLLYTSDAADERSSVDLGGRRIIKKKKRLEHVEVTSSYKKQRNHNIHN